VQSIRDGRFFFGRLAKPAQAFGKPIHSLFDPRKRFFEFRRIRFDLDDQLFAGLRELAE
jgi:hypothetical protein